MDKRQYCQRSIMVFSILYLLKEITAHMTRQIHSSYDLSKTVKVFLAHWHNLLVLKYVHLLESF